MWVAICERDRLALKICIILPFGKDMGPERRLAYFRRFCEPKRLSNVISIQGALLWIPALEQSL